LHPRHQSARRNFQESAPRQSSAQSVGAETQRSFARGWTKVHSTEPDRRGAINLEWDANTNLLLARVITRGQGKPSLIIGDFVHLLMSKYRKRIQAINIIPRG